MFGLGPASSAHHLLTDHNDTALKGAAGLRLGRYTLTYEKEQNVIGCSIFLFNNSKGSLSSLL